MRALVRRPDGDEEEIDISEEDYIEPGDILDDGSVVLSLKKPDDDGLDAISMGFFADENEDGEI